MLQRWGNALSEMKPRRAKVAFSNGAVFEAELALSTAQLTQGLRGRAQASPMLFVFASESYWSMTMAGVDFPLDMVMLDAAGVVVDVMRAPARADGPFTPREPSRYTLELPAGWAEGFRLRRGMRAAVVPMVR